MSAASPPGFRVGPARIAPGRFFLIAGPDTAESRDVVLRVAEALAREALRLDLPVVFKASYRKANRSAADAYTGPGLEAGLRLLAEARAETGLPLLSDVHGPEEVPAAAEVLDVLQIPAFLSRQTDLLTAAARTGRAVNVKKGQFLAPDDMRLVAEKVTGAGNRKLILTERGTVFGFHDLVVDMRGFASMAELGFPIAFDASHAVQRPSGDGRRSGGDRRLIPSLARAALAAGADGLFLETHPDPERALCDGTSQLPLADLPRLLDELVALAELKAGWGGG
ncbi:MAG TPA: 3-deoxy-8-phosphooctulonate synthase [Gemmatimonadota bacterium]|jgi:2-dehydro-3-deoxyphosphooctonate aldolase (KDO 8-P synthase)